MSAQFLGINGLLRDVFHGREWLMLMGRAAAKAGITIQYCMSWPRHAMQALEIPAVTQVSCRREGWGGGGGERSIKAITARLHIFRGWGWGWETADQA